MSQSIMNTNQIEQIKELLQKEIGKLVETAIIQSTQKKTISIINRSECYMSSFNYEPNYLPENMEINFKFDQSLIGARKLIKYINGNKQNDMIKFIKNSTIDQLRLAIQLSEHVKNIILKEKIIYHVNLRASELFPKVYHALCSFEGGDCFIDLGELLFEIRLLNPKCELFINSATIGEFNEQQYFFKSVINKRVACDNLENADDVMRHFKIYREIYQVVKQNILSCLGKDRQLFE